MKASWMNELFGTYKPIIAMCHFKPCRGIQAMIRTMG